MRAPTPRKTQQSSTRQRQMRVRLSRLFTLGNLGIAPRLALAFVSVAILAAASNLIVENGASIIQLAIGSGTPVAADEPAATVPMPEAVPERDQPRVTVPQFALAWGNFDKAVREHAEARSRESAALYAFAHTELQEVAGAFIGQRAQLTGDPMDFIRETLRVHEASAEALIKVARDRRAALAAYSTTFASMNARLQASIDGAWKIMGRVVARQSLLKLSAELDVIQDRFATRDGPTTASDGLARLLQAERAFAATLEANAATLRRSQGAEWYSGLNRDFTLLTTSRDSLVHVEARRTRIAQAYSRETAQFIKALAQAPSGDSRRSAVSSAPVPLAESAPAALTTNNDTASTPATAARPMNAAAPNTPPRRPLVAWLSGIVLAVLAYICIATTLSVVRPVRKLIAATARVANGRPVVPVTLGGIRELDTLGRAFNAMSEQLAAAQAANREALQTLETKVVERTSQLQELAERDPLTGLANRRQLFAALNRSIARATATKRRVGTFFLDIDNFKTLNDSMGHEYGDRVLTAIARRLELTARSFGFAARLGGDEFMLVHEGAKTIEEIVASGTSIVDAFHNPIEVEGRELIVSVSVGASIFPDHEKNAEALLRAADAALFNAKALGRSQLTIFTPELLINASAKFAIEQSLRRAIEKDEFELFYQPEINAGTFEVSMVEALLRWRMPDGSYRYPGEFLAVAEESGLILDINEWVLRTAIETAAGWHHGAWPEVRVAINVSPRQFLDYRFAEKLQDLLNEFRLPARCLELELTESVLQTGPTTATTLSQLRSLGVAIALDDFGTGYSSIASLEQLPLTRVKLDRSLIEHMDTNARSASIARATIGLCSELDLKVTAEGVERIEQFTALLSFPSTSMQGFLLARPVARDDLLAVLKRLPEHCHELLLLSQHQSVPMRVGRVLGGDSMVAAQVQSAS